MDFLNTRSPYTIPPVNVFKLRITESNVKSDKTGTKGQHGFGFLCWLFLPIPFGRLIGGHVPLKSWRHCIPPPHFKPYWRISALKYLKVLCPLIGGSVPLNNGRSCESLQIIIGGIVPLSSLYCVPSPYPHPFGKRIQ